MNIFDIAKNINKKTGRLVFEDDPTIDFNQFMINKIFSKTKDTLFFANEVNKFTLQDKQMIYDFYYHVVSKSNSRYGAWDKPSKDDNEIIDLIKQTYGYSHEKAVDVLPILRNKRKELEEANFKGGFTKQSKGRK